MNLVVMEVTPGMAEQWLSQQCRNRTKSPAAVKRYLRMMEEGSWESETNETIAFNKDGVLIDGQHRLEAVIRFGKPVMMAVIFGCNAHIGITRTRSVQDIAQIVFDEKLPRNAAAVIRAMHCNEGMTHSEVIEAYRRHRDAVDFALRELHSAVNRHVCVAPVQAAVCKAYPYLPTATLQGFCKALRSGIMHLTIDANAVRLSHLLQKQADGKRNSMSSYDRMLCTEYTLDQYAKGKVIKSVKIPTTELFQLHILETANA